MRTEYKTKHRNNCLVHKTMLFNNCTIYKTGGIAYEAVTLRGFTFG